MRVFMETELKDLVKNKDVIVPPAQKKLSCWLIECYQENADIQIIENAHQLDTGGFGAMPRQPEWK